MDSTSLENMDFHNIFISYVTGYDLVGKGIGKCRKTKRKNMICLDNFLEEKEYGRC